MIRTILSAVVAITLTSPVFAADTQAPAAAAAKVTPVRVQVTLSRFEGDRRVASMPYSLLVNAGQSENRVTLRMGVNMFLGNPPSVREIGTNMDCRVTPEEEGRFWVTLAVNHSSVHDSKAVPSSALRPEEQLVRSFTSSFSVLLRNNESAQSLVATDPVTGEVMKIDVSLTVLK